MQISIKLLIILTCVFCAATFYSAQNLKNSKETPPNITYIPKPKYTDEARKQNVSGKVFLRITFLSNGKIGNVSDIVERNSDELRKTGLVDQAIIAAKKIKFEPATKQAQPITVTRTLYFTFTIY